MITVEEHHLVPNDLNISYDRAPLMDCSTNMSNFLPAPSFSIQLDEGGRIDTLEKSIVFLRQQHEHMLKGLQGEIEHLRKVNKALQFRLIMCCCTKSASTNKPTETTCSVSISDLQEEVTTLRRRLEEEREKNNLLTQQVESIQLNLQAVIEIPKTATRRSARKSTKEHEAGNARVTDGGLYERQTTPTPNGKRGSQKRDRHQTEVSETDRLTHPDQLHRGSATGRIHSPDLNPESSSSAILLTPRTSINPPDGFWVRPSIANLQNKLLPPSSISPRDSGVRGTHITPVKLPIIRSSASINQAKPEDGEYPVATMDAIAQENSNRTCTMKGRNAEFAQSKIKPPTRRSLRHNSTAVCDPLRELSAKVPSEYVRHSVEYLSDQLGPFLPALPKSGDSKRAERTRFAKGLQRKRSNRTQNFYPT